MAYFSLTAAAEEIGICRAWLYRKYLITKSTPHNKYRPKQIGGSSKLTAHQVEQIRLEVENGGRPKNSKVRSSKSRGDFQCDHCPRRLSSLSQLDEHLFEKHGMVVKASTLTRKSRGKK